MSSIDNRLKDIWTYCQSYNKTHNDLWLDMLENCTFSDDALEVAAAHKVLSRYKKAHDVSNTG